ncbi:MAG: MMPL family transporter [Candidatus Dormibacteria bacterium]
MVVDAHRLHAQGGAQAAHRERLQALGIDQGERRFQDAAASEGGAVGIDQAVNYMDFRTSLGSHLPAAAVLLAVTTLLILFVMTGSLVLPVLALLMNLLTLGATLGLLVVVFQKGFLSGVLGFSP